MEERFASVLDDLNSYEPTPWEMIPDLGLYMDQVITFITRMYAPLFGDNVSSYLSAPMINNYVKGKLIPRPEGKKYSREQIALLAIIVVLKRAASMEDIRRMLELKDGQTIEQLYNQFCRRHQAVMRSLVRNEQTSPTDLPPAMNFAIVSSGYRAVSEAMLRAEPHQ